ncbi:MAG: sulfite exporter TauE/SafE family protein [Bacilli bacterium]
MLFIVIFISAVIAAITGIGGGIIIRPILSLTAMNAGIVNFYACTAIIFSTIYSMIKAYQSKKKIDFGVILFLSLGSFLGGFIGNVITQKIMLLLNDSVFVIIQSVLLNVTLSFVIYMSVKHIEFESKITSKSLTVTIGLLVGILSVFVGIGGGVLNVIILGACFKMSRKSAIITSLIMVFISQTTNMLLLLTSNIINHINIGELAIIIVCSLLGGIIGKEICNKISSVFISKIFVYIISIVLVLNIFLIVEKLN